MLTFSPLLSGEFRRRENPPQLRLPPPPENPPSEGRPQRLLRQHRRGGRADPPRAQLLVRRGSPRCAHF